MLYLINDGKFKNNLLLAKLFSFSLAYCDFEHGDDICGFIQDSSDDFDWTLGSGATVTPGTGPPYDHTYQSPEGKQRI